MNYLWIVAIIFGLALATLAKAQDEANQQERSI